MEADRIIKEYRSREERQSANIYNMLQAPNWLVMQSMERALLRCLAHAGLGSIEKRRLLDVGCGAGGQLLRWIQWGAQPANCAGVDLIPGRIERARDRLPAGVSLTVGDASKLPFADGAFDITTQFTVLSSILNDEMQRAVTHEMLRVTAPAGLVISYDFWLNPRNPATRGIRPDHLRRLFPGCRLFVQRITLAPPICRRLAPLSPWCCRLLEGLKLFNSHFLVMIQRRTSGRI